MPNMLEKRRAKPGVACLKGNIIVVAGGWFDGNYLATVECLSKDSENESGWTAAWKRLAPMQQPRGFFGLVEFRDKLLAVGGRITCKPNITNTASVELFQPPGANDPGGIGLWTRITSLPRPLQINGCVLSPIMSNGIFAFGKSNAILLVIPFNSILALSICMN